jgi:hypothetical protein
MEQSNEIQNIQERYNYFKNPLYIPEPHMSNKRIKKLISEIKDTEYIEGRNFNIHRNHEIIEPEIDPYTIIGYLNRQRNID